MVAGFYNASLTRSLAIQAFPALYVDLDADLTISTEQALDWLLGHGLLVRGSLVGYDDWHEAPFLRGGESLAHLRITRRFEVEWEHLPTSDLLREEELLGEEDAARVAAADAVGIVASSAAGGGTTEEWEAEPPPARVPRWGSAVGAGSAPWWDVPAVERGRPSETVVMGSLGARFGVLASATRRGSAVSAGSAP